MLTIIPDRNRLLTYWILVTLFYASILCAFYITAGFLNISRLLGVGLGVFLILLWVIWKMPLHLRQNMIVLGPNTIEGPRYGSHRKRLKIRYDQITTVIKGNSRLLVTPHLTSENKDVGIAIHYSISDEDYNRILEKLKEVGVSL